jgi:DNA-binding PadR family transcriptional regulator
MNFKSVLLGFLTLEDLSGYELKAMMDRSVGFFFGATYGSIYPALRELEAHGMVEKTTIVQSRRPNKNVYKLTPAGYDYFRAQLDVPPAQENFRSEFMIKLFFGRHQRPEKLLEWITQERDFRQAQLRKLQETEKSIPAESVYPRMCLNFGLTYYTGTLSWLDEVEAQVRALAKQEQKLTANTKEDHDE